MSKKRDDEKFKNLVIYGVSVTDDEISEMAPFIVIAAIVILLAYWPGDTGCIGRWYLQGFYRRSRLYERREN